MGVSQSLPTSVVPSESLSGDIEKRHRGFTLPTEEDEEDFLPPPRSLSSSPASRRLTTPTNSPDFKQRKTLRLDSVRFRISNSPENSSREVAPPPPPFSNSNTGLSLSHITKGFITLCGGREVLQTCTVEEVVERFILPHTADDKNSYCEKLRNDSHPAVKQKAQVYVVYPAQTKFLDLLDMLQEQYRTKDVILWWDIFSTNYHSVEIITPSLVESLLQRILAVVDSVVLLLSGPSFANIVSSPALLFRLYFVDKYKIREAVHILMLEETKASFNQVLENVAFSLSHDDSDDELCQKLVAQLDPAILSFVQGHIGVLPFHQKIFSFLRQWLMSYMEELYQNTYDLKRRMGLEKALLDLYRIEGIAKSHLHSVVLSNSAKGRRKTIVHDEIEALAMTNKTASILTSLGQFAEAEKLFKVCLSERRRILGKCHEDTISTEDNLVALYQLQGKAKEAMYLLTGYHELRKATFGDTHAITIKAAMQLVEGYDRYHRVIDAEILLHQTWLDLVQKNGEDHVTTLDALHHIAVFYCQHAEWKKAESLLLACLDRRRQSLGEKHPATLSTAYWTAYCWHWQGNTEEALHGYAECLQLQEEVLGRYHSKTLQTLNQHASLLQCTHVNGEEALTGFQDYYKRKREKYGEKHPESILAFQQLAMHLEKRGDFQQAEDKYMQVYRYCLEVFGDADMHTWQAMKQLAVIYEKLGKYHDAEAYAKSYKMHAEDEQKRSPELLFDATNVLASVLWSAGKLKEVESLMQDFFVHCRNTYGAQHPCTEAAKKLQKEFAGMKKDSMFNFSFSLGSDSSSGKSARGGAGYRVDKDENCVVC